MKRFRKLKYSRCEEDFSWWNWALTELVLVAIYSFKKYVYNCRRYAHTYLGLLRGIAHLKQQMTKYRIAPMLFSQHPRSLIKVQASWALISHRCFWLLMKRESVETQSGVAPRCHGLSIELGADSSMCDSASFPLLLPNRVDA